MRDDDFERLYEAHAQALFGFLAYRTGDRALAEDLLADTFERAYRARRGFDRRKASEKTWLYTIALNRLRDHVRRQGAEVRALERTGPGGEAVALRFGADLTVPEIAKVTRESRSTVHGRVYRALRKMRDELG